MIPSDNPNTSRSQALHKTSINIYLNILPLWRLPNSTIILFLRTKILPIPHHPLPFGALVHLHTRISRCWLRRTNFLESMLSPPLSLCSANQRMRGAHRLFAHMRSRMSVKTQEDPLNLHIFHLDVLVMKNKTNKDLRWPLLELLKSSKILFTV